MFINMLLLWVPRSGPLLQEGERNFGRPLKQQRRCPRPGTRPGTRHPQLHPHSEPAQSGHPRCPDLPHQPAGRPRSLCTEQRRRTLRLHDGEEFEHNWIIIG